MNRNTQNIVLLLAIAFMWCITAANPLFAASGEISDTLEAGSVANEVHIRIMNNTDKEVKGVTAAVTGLPESITNLRISPKKIRSIKPGKSSEFKITFDVADNARSQNKAEIVFSVRAGNADFDEARPRVVVSIAEKPKEEIAEQTGKYVYVLTDINAGDLEPIYSGAMEILKEHKPNQLGFIMRTTSPIHTSIEMIRCIECPDRIVLGESFHFKLEARIRYDQEKYMCDRASSDRSPPGLSITVKGFEARTKGKGLHFPDCQELGIKKRKDTTKNVHAIVNEGMVYDPVGLTLEERVSLAADFNYIGDGTDYDAIFYNDPAFIYLAKYRSDGTLSKNTEEDKIIVEYSNTKLKTPEYLMSKELRVSFPWFSLIYTLQVKDQPKPVNAVSLGIPRDFSKPHLSGTTGADKEQDNESENTVKSAKKTVPAFKKATAKEVISKIRTAGLTPKINIVKASYPDQTGKVSSLTPPLSDKLKPGTIVLVNVFGPYVKTSEVPNIKGTTVKDVMNKIKKAGLKPKINIVKADSPGQTGKIRSLDPPQGTELKPGMIVFVDVFGPYVKTIKVPNVKGSTEKEARNLLDSVGLKLRIADSKTTDDRLLAGTIKSQTPEVGTIVKKGKTIEIVVYKKSRKIYCEKGTWDSYKGRCVTDREKALARLSCPFCETPYYDEAKGKARCVCASGCDIDSTISDYCMKKDKLARIKMQRQQDQGNRERLQEQDQRRREENQRKRAEEQHRENEQEEARKQQECQKHLSQLNNSVLKKKRQLEQMIYLTSAYSSNCDPKEITAAQQGKWQKGGSSGSPDTRTGSSGTGGGTGGIIYDGDYGPEIGSGPCAGILGSTPDTKECNPGKYK